MPALGVRRERDAPTSSCMHVRGHPRPRRVRLGPSLWIRTSIRPTSPGARGPWWLPAPEQQVRHAAGARHGLEVEPVEQVFGGGPESLPSAELDGRDGDMHGVDEVRRQELPNGGNAAPEPYILPTSGVLGPRQRLRGCGVEEVERG